MSQFFATFSNFVAFGQRASVDLRIHIRRMVTAKVVMTFSVSAIIDNSLLLNSNFVEKSHELLLELRAQLRSEIGRLELVMSDTALQQDSLLQVQERLNVTSQLCEHVNLMVHNVDVNSDGVSESFYYTISEIFCANRLMFTDIKNQ
jgi:hypothetical protein